VQATQYTFTEFIVPTPLHHPTNFGPESIVAGPDGNLWFTESDQRAIGRITTGGGITEFVLPDNALPNAITSGPGGSLWFTAITQSDSIGRITPNGEVTFFPLPVDPGLPPLSSPNPRGITAGPDGNLWFVEQGSNKIGRMTTDGTVTEYAIPTAFSEATDIVAGPDGNLWFTEANKDKIGRITPAGVISEFAAPMGSRPRAITSGPDARLYAVGVKVLVIEPSTGAVSLFRNLGGDDITVGPDGNIWWIAGGGMCTAYYAKPGTTGGGGFARGPLGTCNPRGITAGPDGRLWFTNATANKVVRLDLGPATPTIRVYLPLVNR
jgi:streptogramin lyase